MQKNTTLFLISTILSIIFICTASSYAQIKISWDDDIDGDIATYKIFLSEDTPDNFINPPGWYSKTNEFTIKNPDLYLDGDTIYYFMIRAYSKKGCESDDSAPVFYYHSSASAPTYASPDNASSTSDAVKASTPATSSSSTDGFYSSTSDAATSSTPAAYDAQDEDYSTASNTTASSSTSAYASQDDDFISEDALQSSTLTSSQTDGGYFMSADKADY